MPGSPQHGVGGLRAGLTRAVGGRWIHPRRQLFAIGVAAAVVPLVLAGTALDSLGDVNRAHAQEDALTAAQVDFLLADKAHDTMRGDVLAVSLAKDAQDRANKLVVLERDVERFRDLLREVDAADLPRDVMSVLDEVRPVQNAYAQHVLEFGEAAAVDRQRADDIVADIGTEFAALTLQQAFVTDVMSRSASRLQREALDAERTVRARLVASAVAALIAMIGFTLLLRGLGGRLGRMLARERGVAELLQRSLLPDRLPDQPGIRLAARYVPGAVGSEVGGDWYDVIPLPSGRVGLVMGDVVGHDLAAAANMGQLRNGLRACAAEGSDPGEVLLRLNRLCLQQNLGSMATVAYAVLDLVSGTLRVASAGHYPPLLVREGERRYLDVAPGPPIGATREVRYPTTRHHLLPGSLLLLYTDGLVERRDADIDEGMRALHDLVSPSLAAGELEEVCDAVLAGMLHGRPTDDDVALLAVAIADVLGPHLDLVLPADPQQLVVLRPILERWLAEAGATDEEVHEITVASSAATSDAIDRVSGPGPADVEVVCDVHESLVTITVRDWVQQRDERGDDRGRRLLLMQQLMDDVAVDHGVRGTQVVMTRRLAVRPPGPSGSSTAGRAVRIR